MMTGGVSVVVNKPVTESACIVNVGAPNADVTRRISEWIRPLLGLFL